MSEDETTLQIEKEPRQFRDPDLPGLCLGPQKQMEFTLPNGMGVMLSTKAFSQLFAYAYATDLEVSLLGIVEREKSLFTVREFHLVEQSGAYSHTELEPSAVGELVERLMSDGRSEDATKIRCWAHSHPGMDVFWSQTDDNTSRLLCADWLLSIVVSDGFRIRCGGSRRSAQKFIGYSSALAGVWGQRAIQDETARIRFPISTARWHSLAASGSFSQ